MKIDNLDDVNRIYKIYKNLINAKKEIKKVLQEEKAGDYEGSAISDLTVGYNCIINEYRDLRGEGVNLDGCYVFREVMAATLDIVEEKIILVEKRLEILGVEF